MAHFAKLDENNQVIDIIVVDNNDLQNLPFPESEPVGIAFLNVVFPQHTGGWKQTSYNGNFRRRYAALYGTYNQEHDVFIFQQPFPSWTLDADFDWQAPTPKPEDTATELYVWDEATLSWINVKTAST